VIKKWLIFATAPKFIALIFKKRIRLLKYWNHFLIMRLYLLFHLLHLFSFNWLLIRTSTNLLTATLINLSLYDSFFDLFFFSPDDF